MSAKLDTFITAACGVDKAHELRERFTPWELAQVYVEATSVVGLIGSLFADPKDSREFHVAITHATLAAGRKEEA